MIQVSQNGKTPPFTVEVETIDKAKADRYLSVGEYDKQRNVSSAHVRHLIAEMESGRFLPTGEISIAHLNGHYHTINGQHTLTAIRESSIPQTCVVRRYQCKTRKDVGRLYSTFDIGKPRRPYDRLRALGITDLFPTNATRINGINSALKIILNDFEVVAGASGNLSDRRRQIAKDAELWASAWSKYKKEIGQYLEVIDLAEDRITKGCMSKAGIISVALVTLESEESALRFWERVAADDGLKADDPAHRLHKWLIVNRKSQGAGSMWSNYIARAAATCWNSYYESKEMSRVSVPHKISIKGTRWE